MGYGSMKPNFVTITRLAKGYAKGAKTHHTASLATNIKQVNFQCFACPPGKYEHKATSAGTYSQRTGSACFSCPKGKYGSKWGQTSCKVCGTGYYVTGETKCVHQRTASVPALARTHQQLIIARKRWAHFMATGKSKQAA